MEQAYGAGIPAVPYLWMAFGSGALIIFGYSSWLCLERLKLRKLLVVVQKDR